MRKVYCDLCGKDYSTAYNRGDYVCPVCIPQYIWDLLSKRYDLCYECRLNISSKIKTLVKEEFENGKDDKKES